MRKRTVISLVMIVSLWGSGCATMKSPNVTPATKVDVALYEALASIQDAEMAARYTPIGMTPLITLENHKKVSQYLSLAFAGLAGYNDALELGNMYTATQKLQQVQTILKDLLPILRASIKDPATQQQIVTAINVALAVIAPLIKGGV